MQLTAIDGHRIRQCVLYSFVSNECEDTLGLAVDAFVEQMRNVNNTEAAISGLPRTMLALCIAGRKEESEGSG